MPTVCFEAWGLLAGSVCGSCESDAPFDAPCNAFKGDGCGTARSVQRTLSLRSITQLCGNVDAGTVPKKNCGARHC